MTHEDAVLVKLANISVELPVTCRCWFAASNPSHLGATSKDEVDV